MENYLVRSKKLDKCMRIIFTVIVSFAQYYLIKHPYNCFDREKKNVYKFFHLIEIYYHTLFDIKFNTEYYFSFRVCS